MLVEVHAAEASKGTLGTRPGTVILKQGAPDMRPSTLPSRETRRALRAERKRRRKAARR